MNPTYELYYFYQNGWDFDGHGGPYHDLGEAYTDACNKLRGCHTLVKVNIVNRQTGKVAQTVHKSQALQPEYCL